MKLTATLLLTIALSIFTFVKIDAKATTFASYNSNLSGQQIVPLKGCLGFINSDSIGDLTGTLRIELTCDGTNITGGNWTKITKQVDANGDQVEIGTLVGTVVAGTTTLNENGFLTSIRVTELRITRGTGNYSTVTSGSGTVEGNLSGDNPVNFSGTLQLSF